MKKKYEKSYVQVLCELGSEDTVGAVRSDDLAPHVSELAALDCSRSLVDVGDLLAVVELGSLGVSDTVNLHQGGVVVGVSSSSVVKREKIE